MLGFPSRTGAGTAISPPPPNGITYIGGDFTHVRSDTGGGAALAATSDAKATVRFPHVGRLPFGDGLRRQRWLLHRWPFHPTWRHRPQQHRPHLGPRRRGSCFRPQCQMERRTLAVSGSTIYVGRVFHYHRLASPGNYLGRRERHQRPLPRLESQRPVTLPSPSYCAVWASPSRVRPSYVADTSPPSVAKPVTTSPPWMPRAALSQPGPRCEQLGECPRRLGLDCLCRRILLGHRRSVPRQHRRPGCHTGAATAWNLDYGSDGTVPWALTVQDRPSTSAPTATCRSAVSPAPSPLPWM